MVPEFSDTNWEAETFDEENISESEPDLPPEYCRYRDEGCDLADSCLDCPFPQCIYEQPRGRGIYRFLTLVVSWTSVLAM